MKLFGTAALLAALALLATPVQAGPPDEVSIPTPRWSATPTTPPVFGPPDVLGPTDTETSYTDAPDADPSGETATGLVELLAESVRAAGGTLEVFDDTRLVVKGSELAIGLARSHVAAVGRFLAQRSTVAVQLVALPPESPAVTSTDEIAAILADAPERLVFASRFVLRRGEREGRDELTEQRFVMAHDLEVAQSAAVSEPIIGRLRTGRRVHVSARPLSNDAALVTLSVGLSRAPDDIRSVETAVGTLDLPEVPFLSLTTALQLEVGASEVLLVANPLAAGGLAIVVSLIDVEPLEPLPFALVDLAATVGHPDLEAALPAHDVGIASPHRQAHRDGYRDDFEPGTTARLVQVVESRVDALTADDAPAVRLAPTVVAILGPDAAGARDGRSLAGNARISRRTMRVPWNRLAVTPGFDVLTGRVDAEALRTDEDTLTLSVPVAARTPLLLLHGTWRRFIGDLKLEIADSSAIVAPVVRTLVAGEALIARPHPATHWRAPHITRRTSRVLSARSRDLDVARDIMGERATVRGHRLDMLRTSDTRTSVRIGGPETASLGREDDAAVIDVWSCTPK